MLLGGIAAGASALGGIVSSIFGAKKASSAAKKQQDALNQQKAKNEAWYNRNYYANYMDSKQSQSAIKRVEDTLRRRGQATAAQAAVTGATPEAAVAQQANDQQLMTDVVSNLASKGDDVRRSVDAQNNSNEQAVLNAQMAQYQANEAGGSQLLSNGGGMIASALSILDGGKNKGKTKTV